VNDKKKRAALDAANIKGGNGKQNAREDEAPTIRNNTTSGGACRVRIADLLHHGSNNGLTIWDLVRLTGLGGREIRRMIHVERQSGALIISDNINGYFLPESADDVRRFIRSMSNRAREIAKVTRAAEDGLARLEGQEQVEGW
jgi:hypothetical protein